MHLDDRPAGPARSNKTSPLFVIALNAVGMLLIVGLLLLRQRALRVTLWEETFDPLHAELWQETGASARWEDLPGPGAALRENDPQQAYGKVESAPITLDADQRPVLHVSVRAVEPGASYTIQVLDTKSGVSRDVLPAVDQPGERILVLAPAIEWQGPQEFSIIVGVRGEGGAVTFDRIAILADRAAR